MGSLRVLSLIQCLLVITQHFPAIPAQTPPNFRHIQRFDLITNCKNSYHACVKACGNKSTKPGREFCDHFSGICICEAKLRPSRKCRRPVYPREVDSCRKSLCTMKPPNATATVPSPNAAAWVCCGNEQCNALYCACFHESLDGEEPVEDET